MTRMLKTRKNSTVVILLITSLSAYAATDIETINKLEQAQFQERKDLIEQSINQPQVNLQSDIKPVLDTLPTNETPCFTVDKINININSEYQNTFRGVLKPITQGQNNVRGKCIGQQGLSYIIDRVQNEILKKGYITSRVYIPEQDLTTGLLTLKIIPGVYNNIWLSPESDKQVNVHNALAINSGDVLNLRDLETSLENFRLPQTTQTNIDIIPSITNDVDESYGSSDLLITHNKSLPLGFQLSIDDSGNEDTGKYQGTFGLTVDHPLNANDVLFLTYSHTIDAWNNTDTDSDNDSLFANYIIPYKDWKLNLNYSDYTFNQTLAGLNDDIVYKGDTIDANASLSRILHRDQVSKTTLNFGGFNKSSKYYFDDQEIQVQRRKTAGWTVGLNYNRDTNIGRINAGLNYEKGTGAFSAIESPESFIGEADDRPRIINANISSSIPFALNNANYYYQIELSGQYSDDRLTPQERFTIGGRTTVRGIDSQNSLAGDKGVLIKQEVGYMNYPIDGMTLIPYITVDHGLVYGESTKYLSNNQLIGGSLGVKLYAKNFSLNGFVGRAIKAPREVEKETVTGFNASIYY